MDFLITTTNSIENVTIERYAGLVSTNVVVGTNMFSDIAASFTDVFGGQSETYQNKLQNIYRVAIDILKRNAIDKGANAIVGLKVDIDEISGKGKSMFMISAFGTAVLVKYNNIGVVTGKTETVSLFSFEKEYTKRLIVESVKGLHHPDKEQWEFLLNNPVDETAPELLSLYLSTSEGISRSNTVTYFGIISFDAAVECLYPKLHENFNQIYIILKNNNLFSPKHVLSLIHESYLYDAIECLDVNKKSYTLHDVELMKKIVEAFESLPDKGVIKPVKGMFGKEKDKYECPKKHLNDIGDDEYCISCGLNIKGLDRKQVQKIDSLKKKIETLSHLLND
jgi:uncharacterized protein YbjQ (UPF0145 family)